MGFEAFRKKMEDMKEPPPRGYPRVGEVIIGKITGIDTVNGKFGKRKILTLEEVESGRIRTLWLTDVLSARLGDVGAVIGSIVGIKYFGKEKNYHDWGVMLYDERAEKEERDKTDTRRPFG